MAQPTMESVRQLRTKLRANRTQSAAMLNAVLASQAKVASGDTVTVAELEAVLDPVMATLATQGAVLEAIALVLIGETTSGA